MKEIIHKKCKLKTGLRKSIPLFFWGIVILLCLLYRDRITVENIVNYSPKNPVLAAGIMLVLFSVKSITFVVYGSLLYAAAGIMFPLPWAILLNMVGSAVMATIPFLIGQKKGYNFICRLTEKYPKMSALQDFQNKNCFLVSAIIRLIGCFPGDAVSMYFGACQIPYKQYLTGTLIGLLPSVVNFSVMGMSCDDLSSSVFRASVLFEVGLALVSMIFAYFWQKHSRKKQKTTYSQGDTT